MEVSGSQTVKNVVPMSNSFGFASSTGLRILPGSQLRLFVAVDLLLLETLERED